MLLFRVFVSGRSSRSRFRFRLLIIGFRFKQTCLLLGSDDFESRYWQ
jgi:hypothetical protein